MRLSYPPFLYAITAATAAIFLGMMFGKDTLQQALYMVRGTARIGLPLVLIIFTASSLYKLWPNVLTTSLFKNQRSWGLSFALTHTVHLFAVLHYLATPGSVNPGPAGIVGYIMIYLMAFSSNQISIRRLGKWWKRIHTIGSYVIWVYYLVSYGQMLFEPELMTLGAIVVPIILGVLIIRFAAWRKGKRHSGGVALA